MVVFTLRQSPGVRFRARGPIDHQWLLSPLPVAPFHIWFFTGVPLWDLVSTPTPKKEHTREQLLSQSIRSKYQVQLLLLWPGYPPGLYPWSLFPRRSGQDAQIVGVQATYKWRHAPPHRSTQRAPSEIGFAFTTWISPGKHRKDRQKTKYPHSLVAITGWWNWRGQTGLCPEKICQALHRKRRPYLLHHHWQRTCAYLCFKGIYK